MRKSRIQSLVKAARESGARWYRRARIAAVIVAGLFAGAGPWGARGEASDHGLAGGAIHVIELADTEELPAPVIRFERSKPGISPWRPGEGVWDASAVGVLDDLVRRGEFAAALRSCESMSKNSQGMSKGVSLRHAVLKLFAPESESELASVLDLLNTACAAGSNLHGEELGNGKLRGWLESTPVSLDESLNQFSRLTLENPEIAVGNLLLISALLKLDGQEARSRIFAEEAYERASQTGELDWSSLMMTLRRF